MNATGTVHSRSWDDLEGLWRCSCGETFASNGVTAYTTHLLADVKLNCLTHHAYDCELCHARAHLASEPDR